MTDTVKLGIRSQQPASGKLDRLATTQPTQSEEEEEESCLAFGFLRGLNERSLALELRFRSGDSEWFPYSLAGAVAA